MFLYRYSVARAHALRFDRGSLRLEAPGSVRVPPYFVWDDRVGAWRTAALNHLRFREDAAAYLAEHYVLGDLEALLDDVYAIAGK